MSEVKDQWMEDVFNSMKGSQKAKPPANLFAKIESQIENSENKVILLPQWKYAAAAAAIVILVNVTAVLYYYQNNNIPNTAAIDTDSYKQSLITNYQIYK